LEAPYGITQPLDFSVGYLSNSAQFGQRLVVRCAKLTALLC
jgi:hypothetical protein